MDIQKFLNQTLSPRTSSVDVPELKDYFPAKTKPVWIVRGLTAAELGRAREVASEKTQQNLKGLIEALAGSGEKSEAVRKAVGISAEEVPTEVTRRIEILTAGSVDPVLGQANRDVAVKLAETFPIVFWNLTELIYSLTGQGAELGKPKRSGKAET